MVRSGIAFAALAFAAGCGGTGTPPAVSGASGSGTGGATTDDAGQPLADGSAGSTGTVYAYVGAADGSIYQYTLDQTSGGLAQKGVTTTGGNAPSWIGFSPDKTRAYSTLETDAKVIPLAVDTATGSLTPGTAVNAGAATTHVSVDGTGRWVFSANYNAGTVMVFPVQGGALGAASQTLNPGTNPHQILSDPSNRFVFVPCKGSDLIAQYRFDAAAGRLSPNTPPTVPTAAGSGPRHLAFHPNAKWVYVIHELSSTMAAYTFDAAAGTLTQLQGPVSTLPAGTSATGQTAAEVMVAPSGRFLYGSNRGANSNSLVIYSIDQTTGSISLVGHQNTPGATPRSFGLDPTGTFLVAGSQDSSALVSFRIDPSAGTLTPLGTMTLPATTTWVGMVELG